MAQQQLKNLAQRHLKYCRLRVESGMPNTACYDDVFEPKTKDSLYQGMNRLERDPLIIAEIDRLRQLAEDESTLSRLEKRQFLARAVRAKLPELVERLESTGPDRYRDMDLIVEINHFYKDGELTKKVYKLPSKLEAIKIDNSMMGHNEPEKHEHSIVEGGVMVIPGLAGEGTLDDYEKAVLGQQRRLKAEAGER